MAAPWARREGKVEHDEARERQGELVWLSPGVEVPFCRGWGMPGKRWPGSNSRHYGINHH
jgi:hypothetical protein